MDNNGDSMNCMDCSCSGCLAHDLNNADHTVICNSSSCDYNDDKSGCNVVEIEIRNGHCESFSEKRKWQLNYMKCPCCGKE